MTARKWRAVVIAATLVGAGLRFHGLTSQSLWLDELLSTELAARSAGAIVTYGDGEPPLHGLLLHLLSWLGLTSDWWLRLPSAVAGSLAIPLVYTVGRRLTTRSSAAVAAALFAIHPFAIWYAQEARVYALWALIALVATDRLLALRRDAAPARILGYGVLVSLGIGLHYYFVFVLAAHAIVAALDLWARPERAGRWLVVGVVVTIASAVWIPGLLADLPAQATLDDAQQFSWFAIPYTGLVLIGGFGIGPPLRTLHAAAQVAQGALAPVAAYAPEVAVAAVVMILLLVLSRGAVPHRRAARLAVLIVVPVLGAWLASAIVVGYRPRYVLPVLPFVLLRLASGLEGRHVSAVRPALLLFAGLELLGVARMGSAPYVREDVRSAAHWVTAQASGGTAVLVGETTAPFPRYAAGLDTWLVERFELRNGTDVQRIEGLEATEDNLFLFSSRPWTVDPQGRIRAMVEQRFEFVQAAEFAGVEVRRYRRRRAG